MGKSERQVTNANRQEPEQGAERSARIPASPSGWKRFLWLGPSFLWMLSAAGSGEVLFTPRIASLYGYSLIWALLAAVVLKWFINKEVGRYTVCTGKSIIVGFGQLPGPRNWGLWVILIPQLVVAVSTIAGMAGAAGDALQLITGGSTSLITVILIAGTGLIVLLGRYKIVEILSSICGVGLSLAVIIAAISILPDGKAMVQGLTPTIPQDIKYEEVLPWLGFMLAGAAGLMWYSNWVQARGYGAASEQDESVSVDQLSEKDEQNLKNWLVQMNISNTLAVVGALLIAVAFLILGAELLRPEKLVPSEDKMSEVLGRLLGNIWGPVGFWFMIVAIFITFWTTTLTNQDGWARMYASGTSLLFKQYKISGRWTKEEKLQKIYIVCLLMLFPTILYLATGKPVGLLKLAGAIEAAHIPVVAGLTLYLNKKKLPKPLAPSAISFGMTMLAAVFFIVFAAFYIIQLMR